MNQALTSSADHAVRGQDLLKRAARYAHRAKSANTRRTYRAAFKDFTAFCDEQQLSPLPAAPQTTIMYLAFIEQQSISTIQVKLAAIAEAHRLAHLPDPTQDEDVKTVMAGLRRALARPPAKKSPITRPQLAAMLDTLPAGLRGQRDRAILLVGFAGAFRRSELVELDVGDLTWQARQVRVLVRHSKTDQLGQGLIKIIPKMADRDVCPYTALRRWLKAGGILSGPIFRKIDHWDNVSQAALRSGSVALIVKAAARGAGLNATLISAHSLRSGFVVAAFAAHSPEWATQKQTGHRSVKVLRDYNQDQGQGADQAARAALGDQ